MALFIYGVASNYGKNFLDLDIEFVVLSGSFYNSEEGETYNFSSGDNPFDDFVTYFEFKEEIEQVVDSFVHKVVELFGFNINNDFDYNLLSNNRIKYFEKVAYKSALIIKGKSFEGVVFKGLSADFNWKNFSNYITTGRVPSLNNDVSNEVLISENLSKKLLINLDDKLITDFDYKNSLPKTITASSTPITKSEILNFRKKLEQKDSLKNLYEGLKPNGSVIEDDIEKK